MPFCSSSLMLMSCKEDSCNTLFCSMTCWDSHWDEGFIVHSSQMSLLSAQVAFLCSLICTGMIAIFCGKWHLAGWLELSLSSKELFIFYLAMETSLPHFCSMRFNLLTSMLLMLPRCELDQSLSFSRHLFFKPITEDALMWEKSGILSTHWWQFSWRGMCLWSWWLSQGLCALQEMCIWCEMLVTLSMISYCIQIRTLQNLWYLITHCLHTVRWTRKLSKSVVKNSM